MKLAIITDTHFGARNDNLNFNEYFYKFYENIFFPTLKEKGITTCVHMGDVVDRRKFISFRIANDFRKRFINKFKEFGIDLHIIIGNHDTYYKNTNEVNSMEELVGKDRFKIYTGPEVVNFDGTEIYWNDFQDPKGFHIFDTNTRELERIVNPYTLFKKIYYDDTQEDYTKHDITQYKDQYVKLIVVNKKDLYDFDKFVDRLLLADAYEVKIIEDFSELDAENVSDDIVENTEDTMTLLEKYIDQLDVTLSKDRLKNTMRALYTEAQDLEM